MLDDKIILVSLNVIFELFLCAIFDANISTHCDITEIVNQ